MSSNEPADDHEDGVDDLDRRTFMKASGGLAGLSLFGRSENRNLQQSLSDSTFEFGGDSLVLGGTHVVGNDGYDTIAAAWDAAESGDVVYVHSSYDAQAAGEKFPIVLDYEQKQVMLTGGHPSGSVIDARHADENVVEVLGRGMNDYRNNPVVQNLRIRGGKTGLRVRAAPYASFRNLVLHENGNHGVHVELYTDPDSGRKKGTFGAAFYNCQAWSAGGDGFRTEVDAMTHATTLNDCKATWCKGAGVRLSGYASRVVNSTIQLNGDYGVKVREGWAMDVKDNYIEGNSRYRDFPIEVYGKMADGLTVEGNYFNGIMPSGATHDYDSVQRAVNVHDSDHVSLKNNAARNYGDGFVAMVDCIDPDVHMGSNHLFDVEFEAMDLRAHGNVRPRSDGVIMPMDLSNVQGGYPCDRGIHVRDNGRTAMCTWRNGKWYTHGVSAEI